MRIFLGTSPQMNRAVFRIGSPLKVLVPCVAFKCVNLAAGTKSVVECSPSDAPDQTREIAKLQADIEVMRKNTQIMYRHMAAINCKLESAIEMQESINIEQSKQLNGLEIWTNVVYLFSAVNILMIWAFKR